MKSFYLLETEKGKCLASFVGLFIIILTVFSEYLRPGIILNASDTITQDYFWHVFFKENLHQGTFSFLTWNPYLNGGASFFSGFHQVFIPISLLCDILFSAHFAITAVGLIHLFLAGVFTLLYARRIGLSTLASLLAAVFFILSTQLVSLFNAGHVNKLNTISYLPIVLFFLEGAITKKRLFDFLLVSLALSLQLYEGHLQISFYTCILVGIYFICRSVHLWKDGSNRKLLIQLYIKATVMVLLFFSLSAATFSQWIEFKEQSERSSGMPYELATNWSMSKKELMTYIVPQLFGLSRENYKDPGKIKAFYWGKDLPFTQTTDYLGLLPLILTLVALIKSRGRYVRLFLGVAILFQILAMGKYTPIYPLFYNYLGFKFFRVPKMNLFIVAFAVSIIAAYGAQWLLEEFKKEDKGFLKKLSGGVFAGGVLLSLIAVAGAVFQRPLTKYFAGSLQGYGRSFNPSLITQRYEYGVEGIVIAAVMLFVCAIIFLLRLNEKLKPGAFAVVMLLFFVIDISIVNYKFIYSVPIKDNVYISKDTAIRYFEKDPGLYRVFNAIRDWQNPTMTSYRITNKYILYKIHSVTGYEAVQVTRYNDFLNRLNLSNRLIDLLNVKYVVIDKNAVKGTVGDRVGKYEIVADKDVKILKNNGMLPRAFPVHRANVINDRRMVMQWLTSPGFDPGKVVLVESLPPGPLSAKPLSESASKVTIQSYGNEEIIVDAEMADNGFVVLSEKYYPGWKAYLNGEEVKIYPANSALRAVYAPKGKNNIIFRYEPVSNRLALAISIITFFIVGLFTIWHLVRLNRGKMEVA